MLSLKKIYSELLLNKTHHKNIIRDPNFELSNVDDGMTNRLERSESKHLSRIIKAYNKAKYTQSQMSPVYQVSNEWLPIYNQYFHEVMEALENEDALKLNAIYNNFMRDDCSIGLHGLSFSMKQDFFSGKISRRNKKKFLKDVIHRMQLWMHYHGKQYTLTDLESPLIGNPYGITVDNHFIRTGSFYNHHYAQQIKRLLVRKSSTRKTVLEIGAGYGAMAYYLCRDIQNLSYVAVDLPENMALTAYYLMEAFPDKKIYIHGEQDLKPETIEAYDIVIMSNIDLENLPSSFFDVVFNSYSLAEMSKETIDFYIQHIDRMCIRYFLHINHNKSSHVVADDFGINEKTFSLLYKAPALWNYGRNIHMDEYEYLYKKITT